jgi:hypothetical protein
MLASGHPNKTIKDEADLKKTTKSAAETQNAKDTAATKKTIVALSSDNQPPAYRFANTVRSRIVRTPFYLFSFCLLFIATVLILIALFTSNWQKTASYLVDNVDVEYYTYGLWFTCRHVNVNWIQNHPDDVYCHSSNYSSSINGVFFLK